MYILQVIYVLWIYLESKKEKKERKQESDFISWRVTNYKLMQATY